MNFILFDNHRGTNYLYLKRTTRNATPTIKYTPLCYVNNRILTIHQRPTKQDVCYSWSWSANSCCSYATCISYKVGYFCYYQCFVVPCSRFDSMGMCCLQVTVSSTILLLFYLINLILNCWMLYSCKVIILFVSKIFAHAFEFLYKKAIFW